jgi:two-component system response regulator YesN
MTVVMRVLIVEDEYYTRQGIVDNIDFAALGIRDVIQADDGVHALEAAESAPPDIVISDIRMPRMDGIAMARELVKKRPGCRFIFMSGFADREYLKAAIDLKAVSFVDKPFRTPELREAIKAAVSSRRAEEEIHVITGEGVPLVQAEITLDLIRPGCDIAKSSQILEALGIAPPPHAPLMAVALRDVGDALSLDPASRKRFLSAAAREAGRSGLACVGAFMTEGMAVLVFFAPCRSERLARKEIEVVLSRVFAAAPEAGLMAGLGSVVTGLADVPLSFSFALSALDAAFFMGRRHSVSHPAPGAAPHGAQSAEAIRPPLGTDERAPDDFQAFLDRGDEAGAVSFLRGIAERMRESGSTEAQGARDCFTCLLSRLLSFAERCGIDPFEAGESERALSGKMARQGTLEETLRLLKERIALIFRYLEEQREEGGPVSRTKRHIHRAFSSPTLSICEIARAVGLSEAYVCRLFHEATGMTVHEYITEYRISRAKELLHAGRQIKMAEVAERVGFSDANYFAKVFRKATGLVPSEYRERRTS